MTKFTCEACGETFTSDPNFPEAERRAEFEDRFGQPLPTGRTGIASVCDDSYHAIITWAKTKGLLAP